MLLGVDVGGTFTDAVLVAADGTLHTAKVPSTPSEESVGVLAAVALVLARAGLTAGALERFAHGMTVATNALLEGRTARTALIATEGFTDVLELARQNRPHLYDLCVAPPAPLAPAELRFAAPERMGPEGSLRALAPGAARELVERLADTRPEAVAISLLHSYRDPAHEHRLGALVAELLPHAQLSLSCELVGTFREYERTATTVLDAALSPLLASYLGRLSQEACEAGLPEPLVMQSSGGLTEAARAAEHAALTVLSGPAGGVAGAQMLAQLAGEPQVLCFDMGGTSCDVCLIDAGAVGETAEREIAGRPLSLPALDIHTVGAGGGSIAWRDAGGALRVGPSSAGARPGPACYGRGGTQPTVTDANLLLGRLPLATPLAGEVSLDGDAAERAVGRLAEELGLAPLDCAEGIVRVAEAEMLGALRVMSIERGIDPRACALMPFGGAGPLHAAALAGELGIDRVLCPRASGVLSALGLAAAPPRRDVARSVLLRGDRLSSEAVRRARGELLAQAEEELGARPARVRVAYELRYCGQSFELRVEEELAALGAAGLEPTGLRAAFAREHERRYGYSDAAAEVELVTMRVSVWGSAPQLRMAGSDRAQAQVQAGRVRFAGEWLPASILHGEPARATTLGGPALCALGDSTLFVPPGWGAQIDEYGTIHLRSAEAA
ncbi:MAG TPA: hydantoinase/oxoprolinase family protein [Solirubrobacteraceae bacterium]|jgi:N-methylhydantoinase A